MPYVGELQYEKLDGQESFVGRPVYQLKKPFGYFNDKVIDNFTVVCDEGFKTDFASIPEWMTINPRGTLWAKAAVIHDKACILAKEGQISYKKADAYLFYALKEIDAPVLTTWLFWSICRINHIVKQFMRL